MSETAGTPVTPAETAPETQQTLAEASTATPADDIPQLTPAQIEKIVAGYKAKVKIEDQEQEVPFEELRRGYQLRQVSDRRMNDADKERTKLQTLVENMKANPEAALRELGVDPLRFSEEQLTRHIQSLKMSPQERAIMEREMQLAERERAIKAQEEQRKAQEEQYLQEQEAAKLDQELTEALQAENFPKSPYAIKRVANIMREYLVHGHNLPAREAVRIAKEDIQKEVQQLIDQLSPEQLAAIAPNGVENLRKSLVAKATGGFLQPTARQAPKQPEAPAVKRRGSLDRWLKDAAVFSE